MSDSGEKVKKIIKELETDCENKWNQEKTMDEVLDIFLKDSAISKPLEDGFRSERTETYFDMKELKHWKEQMNQTYEIHYDREIVCFRTYFRATIIFVKRLIRKICRSLIQPIIEEQNSFNASVTAALNTLYNNEIVTQSFMKEKDELLNRIFAEGRDQDYIDNAIGNLEKRMYVELVEKKKSFVKEIDRLVSQFNNYADAEIEKKSTENREYVNVEIAKSNQIFLKEIEKTKSELRKMYDEIRIDLERRHTQEEMKLFRNTRLKSCTKMINIEKIEKDTADNADIYTGIDYFDFENHFRGSRKEIKDAMTVYLPYFKQKYSVLDLGCGRGEFLELLKENGISGVGVDHYEEFVAFCQAKELNVVCEDVLKYLSKIENNSIGGIFASQLIEHLTNNQLLTLCHLAYEKLESGGCIILETPNPMCLSIYMNAFYVDPSHQKPVHPKTMEYLLNREGFREVEILFTEGSKSSYRLPLLASDNFQNIGEFNDGINLLSDILFGSQDYAVIAKK